MANNVHVATAYRDSLVDTLCAALNAGTIGIYDGSQPANANVAIGAQVLLATLTFGNPAFGASASGTATANAITQDSDADATGTATWARWRTSGAATVLDCSVGTAGCDINFNTANIQQHAIVAITSLTVGIAA